MTINIRYETITQAAFRKSLVNKLKTGNGT